MELILMYFQNFRMETNKIILTIERQSGLKAQQSMFDDKIIRTGELVMRATITSC